MSRLSLLHPAVLAMGLHVARVRAGRAMFGHRRYPGDAVGILRAGLEACWTGEHLTASPGTYRQFWTRDTAFAAPSLVRLGGPWPERLVETLEWAFGVWTTLDRTWRLQRRTGMHVTTTISPVLRWPVDIFDYGVDSLPLLLHSLRIAAEAPQPGLAARAAALAFEHGTWIAGEVEHYVAEVVDPATGLVRADRVYSAHRDTFRNGSTAYANTMVALVGRTVAETGWGPDLLSRHFADRSEGGRPDWSALLRRHFWIGNRFRDRLGTDETSGEANVFPFWAGIVEDRSMQAAALRTLRQEGYAAPYPLRFDVTHRSDGLLTAFRLWSADYQTTTSWTSLGSIYLALLREIDPGAAEVELERMRALIERDRTFWEVLDGAGRPWRSRSRLSVSDVSMLWGAILLELLEGVPMIDR